ncbi:AraC family transcriptional regulator [Clostridiaceae bacterium M8S5]|nr:AraC family transcriptional regulator [Clostridiaceae bacterium M8S5]
MDCINKMKRAIDYIEENITEKIDMDIVAQKACCSSYNFQRLFSFIADISLGEYIRRRKLTLAALEIKNSSTKIIDIALKYGYESPVSFTRAFVSLHGITPTMARKNCAILKAFPQISFHISVKGEIEMDYRIEKKESFEVFGIETTTSADKVVEEVGKFWNECQRNGSYEELQKRVKEQSEVLPKDMCKVHAVMNHRKSRKDTFCYMLCGIVTKDSDTTGYTKVVIPQQTYVVFASQETSWDKTSQEIKRINKRFYSEWLPMSEYERVDGPEFEIYGGTPEKAYFEIWIPIEKK